MGCLMDSVYGHAKQTFETPVFWMAFPLRPYVINRNYLSQLSDAFSNGVILSLPKEVIVQTMQTSS